MRRAHSGRRSRATAAAALTLLVGALASAPAAEPCATGSAHGLSWVIRSDGLMQELNATVSGGSHRVVWAERGRFGPAWVEQFPHSSSTQKADAWKLSLGGRNASFGYGAIQRLCEAVNATAWRVTATAGPVTVTDTFTVVTPAPAEPDAPAPVGQVSWGVDVAVAADDGPAEGRGAAAPGRLTLPLNVGSLVLGGGAEPSSLFRLQADKGGVLEGAFESTGHTVSYPAAIGTFSPMSLVGSWSGPGLVVSAAYTWAGLRLPDSVTLRETPRDQFTAVLAHTLSLGVTAGGSRRLSLVLSVAAASSWRAAALPYRRWFRGQYGSAPSYCPGGPLMYFVGSNDMRAYNHTSHRYAPGSTLRGVFRTNGSAATMHRLGIEAFGVWDTTFFSSYLTQDGKPCEFNPDIELLDPNLDAAWDRGAIDAFASEYAAAGLGLFHFARPCLEIVGANVTYGPEPGRFRVTSRGVCRVADLRKGTAQRDRQMRRLANLVGRGVTGFYFDAMACPGDIDFLDAVRARWPGLFLVKEGCRDIDALRWPQIPILKLPGFPANNSLLLRFVAPHATAYGGAIDRNLNRSEFDRVLDDGYIGFVQNYPASPTRNTSSDVCHYIERSFQNRRALFEAYGRSQGCEAPPQAAPACP